METHNTLTNTAPACLGEELRCLATAIADAVPVEKIICFGSTVHQVWRKSCFAEAGHADWPEKSKHLLLIIPSIGNDFHGPIIQQRAEEAARSIAEVTAIVHSMDEVNTALQGGSAFFSAIYRKGTLIHDRNEMPFAALGEGKPIVNRIAKREQFWEKWYDLARGFLQGAAFYHGANRPHLAVYMLHQALQHCYAGVLRVMTGYRTNSHGLGRLLRLIDVAGFNSSIALPQQTPEEARLVAILLKGYSDARYSTDFDVNADDAVRLMECVSAIIETADRHCRKRMQQLRDGQLAYAV